jgi:hypothetical protein
VAELRRSKEKTGCRGEADRDWQDGSGIFLMTRLKLNPKTAGVNLKRERGCFYGFNMLDFEIDKLLRHFLKKISRALRYPLIGGN